MKSLFEQMGGTYRQKGDCLIQNLLLPDIGQACNERMENIVSTMERQKSVTETPKVTDQMEWVHRMNSIRSRAGEIVLTEFVYA